MDTIVKEKPQSKRSLIPLYRILLHNDDDNDMLHVLSALMRVFGLNKQKAYDIMMEAHNLGLALCAIEPFERAEFHQEQMQSLSLVCTIEPE